MRDYKQQDRDEFLRDSLQQLALLAIREDLGRGYDLTTMAIVPEQLQAVADIVARQPGVACGIDMIAWIVDCLEVSIEVQRHTSDGERFPAGQSLATLLGNARDVLTCERTILNFLGRLCGIATWTDQHVQLVAGLPVRLYDTRKTTPGWRQLEKYAVRCGGGYNHRGSLNEAVLIKDNHLACYERMNGRPLRPSEAVERARRFLHSQLDAPREAMIEVEVDTLEGLVDALQANPDIVLLDNMGVERLQQAVSLRNLRNPAVELEASGGVNLKTLRAIAGTGVERISLGALTHSAVNLDVGLDWRPSEG